MKDGFVRVASANFEVSIANVESNVNSINKIIKEVKPTDTKLLVFPELSITGYTIGDVVLQNSLLDTAINGLQLILNETIHSDLICCVGLPIQHLNNLYNCAAVIQNGKILGITVKTHIPTYNEFYEGRHFTSAPKNTTIQICNQEVPFGSELIFTAKNFTQFSFGVEICEDAWLPNAPSNQMVLNGATIIVNLSASNELATKADYRRMLISSISARGLCGYIYCSSGLGESSTDVVYSGHQLIVENGSIINESELFTTSIIYSEIDILKLSSERRKMSSFNSVDNQPIYFECELVDLLLNIKYQKHPFIPVSNNTRMKRCKEILNIQTHGLIQRLKATGINKVVVGISGGLDSTLALLVCHKAFIEMNIPTTNIIAITMPCFGTTPRTKNNALGLMEQLDVTFETIDITNSVEVQFKDLKQDPNIHDITYENVQARTRTQILMNKSNQVNGLVIGTGDLSEIALGWSTYNGDHMSMYAVNCSIPKTLVRHLVDYVQSNSNSQTLKKLLLDILDTPVSPELLPADGNNILQETEEIVGPYELHDFFLYHMVRFGDTPQKLLRKTMIAFEQQYSKDIILKWMELYYKRFFMQQFKRSCIPDGPKVGSVSLSPRGDWRMPSDGSYKIWQEQINKLKAN